MIRISVIIPTKNRVGLLEKTLQSILCQSYSQENFEVIVVDNGSTDHTAELTSLYKEKFKNLTYILETKPGLHAGRHAGLKIAQGEILAYIDDDIQAVPTWLEAIADSFLDPNVVLVGGNNYPDFESTPPEWVNTLWTTNSWGKYMGCYSILDFGEGKREISPNFIWGCNYSIRKSALLEVGGFHPDGMPMELLKYRGDGESYVSKALARLNKKAIFNSAASIYHFVPTFRMNYDYLYKRMFAQGISDSYTYIREKGITYYDILNVKVKKEKILNFVSSQLNRSIQEGYWYGYVFHLIEVLVDHNLKEWVLKKNYMD